MKKRPIYLVEKVYFHTFALRNNPFIMLRLKESLKKLAAFKEANASRFKISRMGLFGSVARQENTEDSDIDIVVEMMEPDLSLLYELTASFRALFGCEVDVVRMRDSLRPSFKANIQKDAIYV